MRFPCVSGGGVGEWRASGNSHDLMLIDGHWDLLILVGCLSCRHSSEGLIISRGLRIGDAVGVTSPEDVGQVLSWPGV